MPIDVDISKSVFRPPPFAPSASASDLVSSRTSPTPPAMQAMCAKHIAKAMSRHLCAEFGGTVAWQDGTPRYIVRPARKAGCDLLLWRRASTICSAGPSRTVGQVRFCSNEPAAGVWPLSYAAFQCFPLPTLYGVLRRRRWKKAPSQVPGAKTAKSFDEATIPCCTLHLK